MVDLIQLRKTVNGSAKVVTIEHTKVDYNMTKTLNLVNYSTAPDNQKTGAKNTKVMDLLRLQERWTVYGTISEGITFTIDGNTDTSSTAKTRMQDLKSICKAGEGTLILRYDGEDFDVFCEKVEVSDVILSADTLGSEEIRYNITATFVLGDNLFD
jgi:hypothetical protein